MKIMEYKGAGRRNRKGFSLSELLISMGIMAFVSLAAIGGIALVSRIRETMDRKAQAQMIMLATVSYLRSDLNDCKDPQTMDCSAGGTVWFTFGSRYGAVAISDSSGDGITNITRAGAKVRYYNTDGGIMVRCEGYLGNDPSMNVTEYIIAADAAKDSGLISRIKDESISYYEDNKIFAFTIEIVDTEDSNKVILSQEILVCPYSL